MNNGVTQGKKGAVAQLEHINEISVGVPSELVAVLPPLCENVKCRKRLGVEKKFRNPRDGRWWPKYCNERCSSTAWVARQALEKSQARPASDLVRPAPTGRIEIQATAEDDPPARSLLPCKTRAATTEPHTAVLMQVPTPAPCINLDPGQPAGQLETVVCEPVPATAKPNELQAVLDSLLQALRSHPDAEAFTITLTCDREGKYTYGMPMFRPREH